MEHVSDISQRRHRPPILLIQVPRIQTKIMLRKAFSSNLLSVKSQWNRADANPSNLATRIVAFVIWKRGRSAMPCKGITATSLKLREASAFSKLDISKNAGKRDSKDVPFKVRILRWRCARTAVYVRVTLATSIGSRLVSRTTAVRLFPRGVCSNDDSPQRPHRTIFSSSAPCSGAETPATSSRRPPPFSSPYRRRRPRDRPAPIRPSR
jgi:hypothetical protein